jgi:hypothetical protein
MPFLDGRGVATAQWELALLKISAGSRQEPGVVVQEPDGFVALATQEAANPAGPMFVIHMELLDLETTDGTPVGLHDAKEVINLDREPILPSQVATTIDLTPPLLVDSPIVSQPLLVPLGIVFTPLLNVGDDLLAIAPIPSPSIGTRAVFAFTAMTILHPSSTMKLVERFERPALPTGLAGWVARFSLHPRSFLPGRGSGCFSMNPNP